MQECLVACTKRPLGVLGLSPGSGFLSVPDKSITVTKRDVKLQLINGKIFNLEHIFVKPYIFAWKPKCTCKT